MKTFKQFLGEMHYGSLIDRDKYNSLDFADNSYGKRVAQILKAIMALK